MTDLPDRKSQADHFQTFITPPAENAEGWKAKLLRVLY
jgi:hypothetical protein